MPKQNPWALARPAWTPETATFTDPRHPGVEFTLTVRPLDGCELMLALERAAELAEEWITGKGDAPANAYPLGGGEVKLSDTMLRSAVLIEAQQLKPDGTPYAAEGHYDWNDLIGIAFNAPAAWSRLGPWAQGLLSQPDLKPGNGSGAGEVSSSAPS